MSNVLHEHFLVVNLCLLSLYLFDLSHVKETMQVNVLFLLAPPHVLTLDFEDLLGLVSHDGRWKLDVLLAHNDHVLRLFFQLL